MPSVSVIVPNYNHARYLRQRIDSILRQTFQDFELILLDDCSTDNSREILSSYTSDPRVTIEFNERNSGSTFKQWNKGVRIACGEYVWIAESDDYADERFLATLKSRLDEDPRATFCYCRSRRVSAEGELDGFLDSLLADPARWTADFSVEGDEECRNHLVYCNTVLSASSAVFRRDVYWRAGGADETLVLCGDWKTWASMAITNGTISYVSEPLNYYRFHEMSVRERSGRNGIWPAEALRVVGWLLQKVALDQTARTKVCTKLSQIWIPAVLNPTIPIGIRWAILKHAAAIDSRAPSRLVRPALTALRMTLARRWRSLPIGSSSSTGRRGRLG